MWRPRSLAAIRSPPWEYSLSCLFGNVPPFFSPTLTRENAPFDALLTLACLETRRVCSAPRNVNQSVHNESYWMRFPGKLAKGQGIFKSLTLSSRQLKQNTHTAPSSLHRRWNWHELGCVSNANHPIQPNKNQSWAGVEDNRSGDIFLSAFPSFLLLPFFFF